MYSNNILNIHESTKILNTQKSGNISYAPRKKVDISAGSSDDEMEIRDVDRDEE